MLFHDGSEKGTTKLYVNLGESAKETLAMIRKAFVEASLSRTRKAQTHRDREMRGRRKAMSKACSELSLLSRELFAKHLSWQAKQSNTLITVRFNDDCEKMCEDFAPNFGDKNYWLLHHNNAPSHISFLPRNSLLKSTRLSSPTQHTFLCSLDWIWNWTAAILTVEVLEAESHSLNTTSRMNSKVLEVLGTVHMRGRGLLPGWWWAVVQNAICVTAAVSCPLG
jgi:hypothetical protein